MGSGPWAFLETQILPTFKRMHGFMESQNPTTFTDSNNAGDQQVIYMNDEFAFLMESNSIQYRIERNCDLIQVGKSLQVLLKIMIF